MKRNKIILCIILVALIPVVNATKPKSTWRVLKLRALRLADTCLNARATRVALRAYNAYYDMVGDVYIPYSYILPAISPTVITIGIPAVTLITFAGYRLCVIRACIKRTA